MKTLPRLILSPPDEVGISSSSVIRHGFADGLDS
jgi:hypothetical protein